ncbi:MAG: DUF4433 domain-containing protein [Acidimicrobiaceae bacterium]|nr:DUF4433 domain-containing protein [Acidimicrobiaceae bacterium]MYF42654.1 DUF4433 domain-containing protein [Acidimicrobiaceae bacterium]MYJ37162.1 DUF4433 domain-containing protein [Acidimicrobiaceae bacterium]
MSAVEWAPEAEPQSREEAERAPGCPEVVAAAKERGITSIVHFTRSRSGLVGILDRSAVKARRFLARDLRLRHVYRENAPDRSRDLPWHGYVNLSVSAINVHMFRYSKRWHPGEDWVILEFKPRILGHRGVVFSTTNNAYSVAHRATGLQGFEQMFSPVVPWGRKGSERIRSAHAPHETTDPQAEVLYPFELSLEHLRRVIVPDDDVKDAVKAARAHFRHAPKIKKDPEAFR